MDTEIETSVADLSELVAAEGSKGTAGIYEVGYHLLPTIAEEDVDGEASSLKDILGKAGASIIGERAPVKIRLAYSIEKKEEGSKRSYDSAYFGWTAFEALGASLAVINGAFKANPSVLRHLLVATSRDAVAATLADPTLDAILEKDPEDAATAEDAPSAPSEVVESVGADSEGMAE